MHRSRVADRADAAVAVSAALGLEDRLEMKDLSVRNEVLESVWEASLEVGPHARPVLTGQAASQISPYPAAMGIDWGKDRRQTGGFGRG
jgi:hypothetical protein